MKTARRVMLIIGLISLLASTGPLCKVYSAYKNDYYWTHINMKLPLSAGDSSFELYIKGERLQNLLKNRELRISKGGENIPISSDDFALRLNRIHEFTRWSLVSGTALLTIGLVLLIISLISLKWKSSE